MTRNDREPPEPKSLAEMAAESRAGSPFGIACPRCGCIQFRSGLGVRNTRKVEGAIKRYRVCRTCGKTWTTFERNR